MSITTVDGWIASGKQYLAVSKSSLTTVAGNQYSLWLTTGQPAAGAAPGAVAVPTSATQGASNFNNPTSPQLTYVGRVDAMCQQTGMLILYDRLSHYGSLSPTLTTSQTINTSAINRGDTTGLNVEAFIETYTALGAASANATVTYTDDTNTSRSGVVAIATSSPVSLMLKVPMAGTAAGVRQIQSVQLSASVLSGTLGVTLCRRLATIPVIANIPTTLDPFTLGLPQVNDNACLFWSFVANATSSGPLSASVMIGQA